MIFLLNPVPYLAQMPHFFIVLVIIVSAAFGSFFTMFYYRVPIILCAKEKSVEAKPLSLCFPASHCPVCQTPLKPWHNIPIVSYLWQLGHCRFCHAKIPLRYFIIEAGWVIASLLVVFVWKITWLSVIILLGFWIGLPLIVFILFYLLNKFNRLTANF